MDIGQLIMNGFPSLATGDIADAGRTDVKVMDFGIKPLHHRMKVAGPVYTIDQPGATTFPILQAIQKAPAGSVLVINAQGYMKAGHVGGLFAQACQLRNIAGIIIDGAVRDVSDIIGFGFPVFSRGAVPRGNGSKTGVLNQSIQCGGISVQPDDMVFADASGVVVFSQAKAQAIYEQAVAIAISEMGIVQQLNQGKTLLEIPEFIKSHNIDLTLLK